MERHRPSALRVATVVLGGAQGADDVVQDATVRVWRSIDRIDPEVGFRAWYLRSVANTARNDRRSRRRREGLALRAAGRASTSEDGPDERAVASEDRARVVDALNRLGREDREILALRHIEQLSEAETAAVLGCAIGTVKSRTSRAMDRLRAEIGARHG